MRNRPFLIAVAGGSGSGKTSVTRELVAAVGAEHCVVIDHDSYYRDLGHQPLAVRAATNFDHPDSLDNELLASHLGALRAGRSIERPCYDFGSHTRTAETLRITPRPIVVVEGILVLSVPMVRAVCDLRVFVDAPADVRALRRLQRDVVERHRSVDSVVRQYLTTVRPMHERFVAPAQRSADLVLDWREPLATQAQRILAAMPQPAAARFAEA